MLDRRRWKCKKHGRPEDVRGLVGFEQGRPQADLFSEFQKTTVVTHFYDELNKKYTDRR